MQPKATQVIVCWNHAAFVEQAIHSALNQTYTNTELIVFDNDSKDGSAEIIRKLGTAYPFQFVQQENIGLIRTLNKGLRLAEGKYFTYLSADDRWLPDKTERQVAYLEARPEIHTICGRMEAIDENGNGIPYAVNNGEPGEVTFQSLMLTGCSVQGPTVMHRTETLRQLGGFDESVRVEDYAAALQFTSAGHRVVNTGETYTLYRRHGDNWTSKPIYHDRWLVGQRFRHTPEYVGFVRHNLAGYFRWLSGHRKRDALHLLRTEPIAWTWSDVGVGLIKLFIPSSIVRWRERRNGGGEHNAYKWFGLI
jgi:alpha-1,3-rhamnosyltransferase